MKPTLVGIVLYMAGVFLFLYGCRSFLKEESIQSFIPGTFIRFSQHEFGTEYDTLVISVQNESAKQYRIQRRWKYERILDGNKIEPEYRKELSSGVYDEKDKMLRILETAEAFSFDPKKKVLYAGTTEDKKIK
jgi:hypothetical protein